MQAPFGLRTENIAFFILKLKWNINLAIDIDKIIYDL